MIERLSSNHARRIRPIRCIVLHADASANVDGTLSWLQAKDSGVSYHVVIDRPGTAYRVVPDDRIAWHAGKAEWQGETMVNAISLGLAFSNRNDGKEPYSAEARDAARVIVADWCRRYQIPVTAITTHAAIATPKGRKDDPKGFDLSAFRAAVTRTLAEP